MTDKALTDAVAYSRREYELAKVNREQVLDLVRGIASKLDSVGEGQGEIRGLLNGGVEIASRVTPMTDEEIVSKGVYDQSIARINAQRDTVVAFAPRLMHCISFAIGVTAGVCAVMF